MSEKHLAWSLVCAALMAAPAAAQPSQPAGSAPAQTSGQMNTGNWLTQEQLGQWRASKLEGLDVYNQGNEKIGDISELLVDDSGKIQAVVISVGGFLGMGERNVAIPFDQIRFVSDPNATPANTTDNRAGGRTGSSTPEAPAPPTNPNMATNNADANTPAAAGTVTTDQSAGSVSRSSPDHAVLMVNVSKEQLKAAPEFSFSR